MAECLPRWSKRWIIRVRTESPLDITCLWTFPLLPCLCTLPVRSAIGPHEVCSSCDTLFYGSSSYLRRHPCAMTNRTAPQFSPCARHDQSIRLRQYRNSGPKFPAQTTPSTYPMGLSTQLFQKHCSNPSRTLFLVTRA
jgi:hypothetical protein